MTFCRVSNDLRGQEEAEKKEKVYTRSSISPLKIIDYVQTTTAPLSRLTCTLRDIYNLKR